MLSVKDQSMMIDYIELTLQINVLRERIDEQENLCLYTLIRVLCLIHARIVLLNLPKCCLVTKICSFMKAHTTKT